LGNYAGAVKVKPFGFDWMAELIEARVADRPRWMDFRTAVRRVLGTAEWRSDEDRVNAAEAKRQRKQKRNMQNRRP
jgi:hypothetical protein